MLRHTGGMVLHGVQRLPSYRSNQATEQGAVTIMMLHGFHLHSASAFPTSTVDMSFHCSALPQLTKKQPRAKQLLSMHHVLRSLRHQGFS